MAGKDIQHVDINGYADDIGEDGYNLKLSERRAKKIALFLMQKGFPVNRIAMKGNGEIHDGQLKSQNRRVELKITTLE
ncbi:MAG: OmpA family protein [Haliscomenobacter sp.]|nr:OmpA family protein [Haliscomenobacter sp.]